jgi:hypothetical protein
MGDDNVVRFPKDTDEQQKRVVAEVKRLAGSVRSRPEVSNKTSQRRNA